MLLAIGAPGRELRRLCPHIDTAEFRGMREFSEADDGGRDRYD